MNSEHTIARESWFSRQFKELWTSDPDVSSGFRVRQIFRILGRIIIGPSPNSSRTLEPVSGPHLRNFSVAGYFSELRRHAVRLGAFAIAGLLAATLYLGTTAHKYDISLTTIPVPTWLSAQPSGGALSSGSGLSALLSGSNQVNLFSMYSDALNNKQIYVELDAKYDVRKYLFPANWDATNKRWTVASGPIGWAQATVHALKSLLGYPAWGGPTIDDVEHKLTKAITVTSNADGSMLIEMKSKDPQKDVKILSFVLQKADELVRRQMTDYVQHTIDNLQMQLAQPSQTSLQEALTSTLASQMAVKASLANNQILALNLTPITVSDNPIYPSFYGTLAVGFLIGFMFPSFIIAIRMVRR